MTFQNMNREVRGHLKETVRGVNSLLSTLPRWRVLAVAMVLLASPMFAQGASPWENAVSVLQAAFTGPIARGLSLVSIVVGGLMFAFDEGGSKKMMAGIIFGVGMAIGAVNFMAWLFP